LARPFLLVQISDPHIGEPRTAGVAPEESLRAVVDAIAGLPNRPDAILVSGDLSENATAAEYALVAAEVGRLGVPFHVLPGNHDDRAAMRASFPELPGEGGSPLDYAVDLGPLRLVVCDSTIPGEHRGGFEPAQLERLDAELADAPAQPTILAMHHPPLPTALPDWDGVNLPRPERQALAVVVARHPQVRAIVAGHLHRISTGTLAGRPVLAAPSTFLQARPDFAAETVSVEGKPPGFVLHALLGDELSTQVELVPLST
jgi:3',5'-cyclic-AMP phosphodiesterase